MLNEENQEVTTLEFDTTQIPERLINENFNFIKGLNRIEDKKLIYNEDSDIIYNKDVISIMSDIKKILRQDNVSTSVESYYISLITAILEVGIIYSSFVEILFTNMFLVDKANKIFWRYRQDLKPTFKLGDRTMATYISSRIGLLFQPNKKTVGKVSLEELADIDEENLTIYEKIYLGKV